jgi:hypothetical protein
VYSATQTSKVADGESPSDALATAFGRVSLVMAILSALGIPLALAARHHRTHKPETIDYVAAAASHTHTLPRPYPLDFVR